MSTFLSGEPVMYEAYNTGKDLYAMIASSALGNKYEECLEFWPEGTELEIDGKKVIAGHKTHLNTVGKENRNLGKKLNLSATYGMGAATAGANMGKTAEEGQILLDNFFAGFPLLKKAIDDSQEFLRKNEYVEDFLGRRRRLPEIHLPLYAVTLKQTNSEQDFNPIIGCENRQQKNEKVVKWEKLIQKNIEENQAFIRQKCLESGKPYINNGEMGNKRFDKLAKEALADGVILQANTARIAQALRQCFNARIQGCLDGEVRVQTKDFGYKKLKDLVNKTVLLWDGCDWTAGTVLYSGKKLKNTITFNSNQKIICSPDHKFLTISTYGTESFKKCSELKVGDRVLINEKYIPSTKKYSSDSFKLITRPSANSNRLYLEDICKESSFNAGRVLGRLASDGSFSTRVDGGSSLTHFVAEHEFNIVEKLESYMSNWDVKTVYKDLRQNRTQSICNITKTSYSLVNELEQLNIKHAVHENIFEDTDLLRGFISGMFDGDGGISGNNIVLTFGTQYDFNQLISDLQKALLFFGIRSSHRFYKNYAHKLIIKRADSLKFANLVGFINDEKQEKALNMRVIKDNHCFNGKSFLIVKDIARTSEAIDMYDVCNTARGYFVADGLITHNSAASLTKLAMVDIYNDDILNSCQTKLIIPVHDELLVECPAYYADIVEKRLPEVMINAAKRGGDDVPQACDPYNVSRWYADTASAYIQKEFKKLLEGDQKHKIAPLSREEALEKIYANHTEFPKDAILKSIETGCDLEF